MFKLLRAVSLVSLCALHAPALQAQKQSPAGAQGATPPPPPGAAQTAVKMPPSRTVEDASAPAGWKKYEFGATPLFTILLPAEHESAAVQVPMGGSDTATTYVYVGQGDSGVFMTMYVEDMPLIAERLSEEWKQNFYAGLWRGMVEGMRSEMEKNGVLFKIESGELKKTKISGHDGREQEFTFGPLKGLTRMVLVGRRAYVALSMVQPEKPLTEHTAFFDSFAIYAKP
jgi:hypothetical protein